MAHHMRSMLVSTYEPPTITKQDAGEIADSINYTDDTFNTGRPHEHHFPDGYDGGNELPDDVYIDRMVYPHSESQMEHENRESRASRDNQAMAFRDREFQRSRHFDIQLGSATGKNPGPRGLFDDD